MNCHEMNFVLDTHTPAALTPSQRAAIDSHYSSCRSCREEWANWRDISALPIPATPPELGARIAAMLPAHGARNATIAGRPRRAFVISSLLVAGAAVATTLVLQLKNDVSETGTVLVESAQDSPEVPMEQATPSAATVPAGDTEEVIDSSAPGAARDTTPLIGLDPYSIAVFARPETTAGAVELAEFAKCHAAIVEQLEALQGLNVIAGARLAAFEGSGLSDREIARQFGAGSYLVVHMRMGCGVLQRDSQSDALLSSLLSGVLTSSPAGWEPFATGVARGVRDVTLNDPEAVIAEAKATLLNTIFSDGERIAALNKLARDDYDSAVVAATAQIGLTSRDVGARISAWAHLRRIDDPYLVQPLVHALANDTNPIVRQQAALTLNTFLDEPGIRDALLRAAAEDGSREPSPSAFCCTVRESAEWASVATDDLAAWVNARLLDDSLPARSRLIWLSGFSLDGRFVYLRDLGDDAPAAVFEIGRNEADPRVRAMAWGTLDANSLNAAFIPVLVEDLRNHPDQHVRSSAASALIGHLDNPQVRSAFEDAVNDSSMAVRTVVSPLLARPPP